MCTCARLLLSMVLLLASSTNPTGVASEGKRVSPNLNSLPFIKNEKKKKRQTISILCLQVQLSGDLQKKKITKWSGYSWFGNSMREQNSFKPIDRIRVLRIELERACTGGLTKRIFSYTTARTSIASHGKLVCNKTSFEITWNRDRPGDFKFKFLPPIS